MAQAEALIYHKEYEDAGLAAYEAAAAAARVPLYQRLVDPFTADEALWEFENLFVLSGETGGRWKEVSSLFADLITAVRQTSVCRDARETDRADQRQTEVRRTAEIYRTPEEAAREIVEEARRFVSFCAVPIGKESGVAA